MALCSALAVCSLWTTSAFAQNRAAPAQPQDTARPSIAEASSGIGWDHIRWIERRYKIQATRFKARDESGPDWWGSDEVMVRTDDAKGWTVSREIGDIDSGDTHHFDPVKSCILPVQPGVVVLGETSVCIDVGEPAPLSFQVEFWEKDPIVPFPGFCLFPPPGHHGGPHCVNDGVGDDFIGRALIDLSTQGLEAALPNVGDEYVETVVLDPCPGAACAGYPDYTFTYRITRLPDVRVDFRSVLDEAMRRSGARSELEAIVAGLRYLRAPSQRKIDPETVNRP
ncbi:MAG TPA: hypothetical protein VNG69_02165 [Casimicrobiaceae bacterium]|nr:hypothetical protein [Casimicrobiaceae bacterium]